jgi:serine/threonine-protein kinase
VLPQISCTWLDIGGVAGGDAPAVTMRGVAGNAGAARAEIGRALAAAGLAGARLDLSDVAPIAAGGCSALDAFRQFRHQRGAGESGRLAVAQPRFEMATQADGQYAGRAAANAVIDLEIADPSVNFTLLGIEPSGAMTQLLEDRGQFQEALAQSEGGRPISDLGNGRYRLHIDLDHEGWSGVLLISGRGPFPSAMVAPGIGERGPDWRDRFLEAAGNLGWQTDMVWFESVNRQPDNK